MRRPILITDSAQFAQLVSPDLVSSADKAAFVPQDESQDIWQQGLLAIGGKLSVPWLLAAYRHGIFPWFSEGQPILWWRLQPRMVLMLDQFHAPKNLLKLRRQRFKTTFNNHSFPRVSSDYQVRCNTAFDQVVAACAQRNVPRNAPRNEASSSLDSATTWITAQMQTAYIELHRAGFAYSVEVWRRDHAGTKIENTLVGGLYGVSIGRMVFGESMFFREPNMSQIALLTLVEFLREHNVPLIDCQQQTEHLARFGARPIPLADFLHSVDQHTQGEAIPWAQWRME